MYLSPPFSIINFQESSIMKYSFLSQTLPPYRLLEVREVVKRVIDLGHLRMLHKTSFSHFIIASVLFEGRPKRQLKFHGDGGFRDQANGVTEPAVRLPDFRISRKKSENFGYYHR